MNRTSRTWAAAAATATILLGATACTEMDQATTTQTGGNTADSGDNLTAASLLDCLDSKQVTEAFISDGFGHTSIEVVTAITEAPSSNFDQWDADQKKGDLLTRQAKRCIDTDNSVYIEFQYAEGGILTNENF